MPITPHNIPSLRHLTCAFTALALSTSINIATANDADKKQELEIAALYVDLMKDMPASTQLISSPYPQAMSSFGTRPRIDNKSIIKGGRALRIKVSKAGKKSYSKGSDTKTIGDINTGDTLCLTFWARNISKPELNRAAEFASFGVQKSSEPYSKLIDKTTKLSYEWLQFAVKAKARESFKAGEAQVFFHYGHLAQRFEIGPSYLFNLGSGIDDNFKSNACGK